MFKKLALLALLPLSLSAMEQTNPQPIQPEGRASRAIRWGLMGKAITQLVGHGAIGAVSVGAGVITSSPAVGFQTATYLETMFFPAIEVTSNQVGLFAAANGAITPPSTNNN